MSSTSVVAPDARRARHRGRLCENYINAEPAPPSSGQYLTSHDPFTGEPWAQIARGNEKDVDKTVTAAKAAFPVWAGMGPTARGKALIRLAALIEENAERLAEIEVRDNGKLFEEMHAQTRYMAEWYRYYGGMADKVDGSVIPTDKAGHFNFTRHEPYGVIAMITPWNSPLLLLSWKLAPALAAGNTAVIKPSEFTSVSTIEFMSLFSAAGFPRGVVNVVTGLPTEAGSPLVSHPDVAKVAFTGSDVSGQKIYETAARAIKPVSLELGGKSPNIVFEDCDLEAAAKGVISGILAASGQTCVAGSRLLLQRSIHQGFIEKLLGMVQQARLGDPMDPKTQVGPITTRPQFEKVMSYIATGKSEGARCLFGGKTVRIPQGDADQFVEPTLFVDVNNDMRIAREEIFGPVLAVISFDSEAEALAIANDSPFGLAAGVWTKDIARAIRMAEGLQSGTVWVNTYRAISFTSPFGGYKRSGLGRESGRESILEYLQTKSVWIATGAEVHNPFIIR